MIPEKPNLNDFARARGMINGDVRKNGMRIARYAARFYDALEAAGYTVGDEYRKGWTDKIAGMPLIKTRLYLENGRGIDVDIFLAESDFQQELLSRRRQDLFDERTVCLLSSSNWRYR